MTTPKLSKNSVAMKLLRRKFEIISGQETPKQVWESEALFKKHKLNTFRVHYNALRKEFPNQNDDYANTVLRPRCSRDMYETPAKRQKVLDIEAEENDDEPEDELLAVKNIQDESRPIFAPLHAMSIWREHDTMTKRVTVAIVLPSGVETGGFSLRVVEGGQSLELTVRWPRPLVDLEMMHKKWLQNANEN